MSTLSTHVLDTSLGQPAKGVRVTLSRNGLEIGSGTTDSDGRVRSLLPDGAKVEAGDYTLIFTVRDYFEKSARDTFYGHITVCFRISEGGQHYHVPLLLSPFGYATYRGS